MLLKKFTSLINLAPEFDNNFKTKLIAGFEKSNNAAKFQLIADMENLMIRKGYLKS